VDALAQLFPALKRRLNSGRRYASKELDQSTPQLRVSLESIAFTGLQTFARAFLARIALPAAYFFGHFPFATDASGRA